MSAGTTARHRRFLLALRQYLLVFLLIAFVLTCCMVLFLNTLTASTGVALTEANVERAAKVTFLNVVLLSALFTAADALRRRWLVDRPARIITAAAEQMMKGDFSVRVPPMRGVDADSGFGLIASYFNLMAGELSGMETLRTDFIANVSHELKTPLATIQNYSTLLAQPNLPEAERIEYARAACDTARRLASLITNILRLNKLENQQVYPNAETNDLGEQLCECLLNFEHAWEEKSLEIETEIEPDVHVPTRSCFRSCGIICFQTPSSSRRRADGFPFRCALTGRTPSSR